ncbi:transposase [Solimonas marina]|uniref:Transposase n=1 Tax=Solimonas marina TaxID=2714601 RepID=A0A969WE13_9GAMM|nr:transposase [Solimonas marina]NKF24499.1 transposase [Solimonas marina]
MARLPRYGVPGQPQHVIQRGNNRSPIFCAPEDYRFFLECLQEGCHRYDCAIHAYVLMTNHVHLLVTPKTADGISRLMQSVGRRYVQYFNFTYQRTGTLWEGRYKAVPIDSEAYVMTCYRYIENNPVRAAMVTQPGGYHWSSYGANADGKADPLVQPHGLYLALGSDDRERCAAYRKFFRVGIGEAELSAVRESINRGWVLGSDRFARKIESITERRAAPLPRGGRRKGAGRPKRDDAEQGTG